MKQFAYTITNPSGIGTRSFGQLAKLAREYGDTVITITKGGDTVKTSQLMRLMGMGIHEGDEVTVSAEGPDENNAIFAARVFFENNL